MFFAFIFLHFRQRSYLFCTFHPFRRIIGSGWTIIYLDNFCFVDIFFSSPEEASWTFVKVMLRLIIGWRSGIARFILAIQKNDLAAFGETKCFAILFENCSTRNWTMWDHICVCFGRIFVRLNESGDIFTWSQMKLGTIFLLCVRTKIHSWLDLDVNASELIECLSVTG